MNIAYFAPIPYDFLMQRPQYLAKELSKRYNVYYVEPTISAIQKVLRGEETFKARQKDISDRLHIVRMDGLFAIPRILKAYDLFGISNVWERRQLRKTIPEPEIIWVGYCGWYPVSSYFSGIHVYDKMDDNSLLARNVLLSKQLAAYDKLLLRKAASIFVAASNLYEEALSVNPQSYLIPNAVDVEFAKIVVSSKKADNKRVFGYIGMIDDWFDLIAVRTIVDASKDNEVVLVGPNNIPEIHHARVKYMGRLPKEELPAIISSFDVCLYPFRQNQLLETINPIKIYEYLALNKPILAVDSREIRAFGELVWRYKTYEELKNLCSERFPEPFVTEDARLQFISNNNWEKRGLIMMDVLEAL